MKDASIAIGLVVVAGALVLVVRAVARAAAEVRAAREDIARVEREAKPLVEFANTFESLGELVGGLR